MADFAAVLRKTLGNMSETTPQLREKVYEKARATVRRQIDAMEKAPPQAAVDRQFAKLEEAINSVEAEYSATSGDIGLEAALGALGHSKPDDEAAVSPPVDADVPQTPEPTVPEEPARIEPEPEEQPQPLEPEVPQPSGPEPEEPAPAIPEPEEPAPLTPEPEVPSVPDPEDPAPETPEPEVPAPEEPQPDVPAVPDPEVPMPSDPEPGIDDRPLTDEPVFDAASPEEIPASGASSFSDEPYKSETDAVEAAEDVSDGLIIGDASDSPDTATEDLSSAFVETPISDDSDTLDPAARDVFDDGRTGVDEVDSALGDIFADAPDRPETAETQYKAPENEAGPNERETDPQSDAQFDPLAEFLKEHGNDLNAQDGRTEEPVEDFSVSADSRSDDVLEDHAASAGTVTATVGDDGTGHVEGERSDAGAGIPPLVSEDRDENKGGMAKRVSILAVVIALLGGGGYLAYAKQDELQAFYANSALPWWQDLTGGEGTEIGDAATSGEENGVPVRSVTSTDVDEAAGQEEGEASDETAGDEAPAQETIEDVSDPGDTPTKFTQRLTEDGTEIDEGPIGGSLPDPDAGEGSSVSQQTAGTANEDTPAGADEAQPETSDEAAATPAPTPVGQRAIFYEERTGAQDGTALAGATVWSVVNESPGSDMPVEPAIRAETSIPDLGLTMEMTIRRNGDSTFPASHIIELFFRVPETFSGRGIADVQRVTFKTNEQDPGNALIAVPAPLDQNIFLIALTDAATAVETNVQLMKRENWIDIPMQYTNGRRALITLEKGIPGERVFNEVFAAWEEAPLNADAAN